MHTFIVTGDWSGNERTRTTQSATVASSASQAHTCAQDRSFAETTLQEVLDYARERNFAGYDYSDGTSSPLRDLIPGDNRWVNIALQETAKRAPINLRPVLGIPKRRNFKGCALFASASLRAYDCTGREQHLDDATELVQWLADNRRSYPYGWGHNHDLQLLTRRIPRNTPDIIATAYGVRAIMDLDQYRETEEAAIAGEAVPHFIETELLDAVDDGFRLRYEPTAPRGTYVLNANAVGGALLVELAAAYDQPDLRPLGEALLDYVASRQHPIGGWTYMDPPEASHLSMDNHHNGFILESFMRYAAVTGSDRYADTLERGLSFYRDVLFDSNGAPRWDEMNQYPRDIHAAAQGIITFTQAGDYMFASRILGWALEAMYDAGRFYYRRNRFYTRRVTLMRWCQAWMAYAIGQYATHIDGTGLVASPQTS